MSVYVPTQWRNGQEPFINAFTLNHVEAGITTAHEEIDDLVTGSTKAGKAIRADTATSVDVGTETNIGGAKIWVDDSDPSNIIGYIDAR